MMMNEVIRQGKKAARKEGKERGGRMARRDGKEREGRKR